MPSIISRDLSALKALLFAGLLYSDEEPLSLAINHLTARFGPIFHSTAPVPWPGDYYADELGSPIIRKFVFFDRLVHQEELAVIKLDTCTIERELSVDGRRRVNIDPGLLNLSRVVLPTTKDYSHRVYLGQGIFAEVPLVYREGAFKQNGFFSYSDYTSAGTLLLFGSMREEFRKRMSLTSQ